MGNLAVIPARGGSKRIPRKNIKEFLGKPVVAYSIELALNCGLFEDVMVSTDDEEIAVIAREYGASVPFLRSSKNANDYATTLSVLKEVEGHYKEKLGKSFDFICCIYPTAPLINKEHLIKGFDKLKTGDFDVVFPVVPFSYPIWRGIELEDNDKIRMVWPEFLNSRSQDLKEIFHDAGQWYWYNPLRVEINLFTNNTSSIILKEEEVQDIDTLSDWTLAEIKYRFLNEK